MGFIDFREAKEYSKNQQQVARKAKTQEVYDPASPSDELEEPLVITPKPPERQKSSKSAGPIKIKLSCYDSQNKIESKKKRMKKSRFTDNADSSDYCIESNRYVYSS